MKNSLILKPIKIVLASLLLASSLTIVNTDTNKTIDISSCTTKTIKPNRLNYGGYAHDNKYKIF